MVSNPELSGLTEMIFFPRQSSKGARRLPSLAIEEVIRVALVVHVVHVVHVDF